MGLTIHYDLKTSLMKPQDVRKLVEAIRQHALDLPFKEVGEVKLFQGPETSWDNKDDEDRWLKIQSAGHLSEGRTHYTIPAMNIVALSTWPGEGCEEANFGLCHGTHASTTSGAPVSTRTRTCVPPSRCWRATETSPARPFVPAIQTVTNGGTAVTPVKCTT